MKLSLIIPLVLVGCLKPVPAEPPKPIVVEIHRLPPTVIKGEMMEIVPDPEPAVRTWLTGDELQKVLEEQAKRDRKCQCKDGDPLCGCLE